MWGKSDNRYNKGSGKGQGKGGKGKAQSWSAPTAWADAPGTNYWGGTMPQDAWACWETDGKGKGGSVSEEGRKGGGKEYVSRLEGRYAFAKAYLQPCADDKGNATYSTTSARDAFSKEVIWALLDAKNSELCRRPPVGMTTIGSSVSALQGMLRAQQQAGEADTASESLHTGRSSSWATPARASKRPTMCYPGIESDEFRPISSRRPSWIGSTSSAPTKQSWSDACQTCWPSPAPSI